MLCAHTVRQLKPGTFDQFSEAFRLRGENPPAGWVRFHLLRGLADENEVVTFGFFDGTLEELDASQQESDYHALRGAIDPLVDSVLVNGVYEIVATWTAQARPPRPHRRLLGARIAGSWCAAPAVGSRVGWRTITPFSSGCAPATSQPSKRSWRVMTERCGASRARTCARTPPPTRSSRRPGWACFAD